MLVYILVEFIIVQLGGVSRRGESRNHRVQTQYNHEKTKYHTSNEQPMRNEIEQFVNHTS